MTYVATLHVFKDAELVQIITVYLLYQGIYILICWLEMSQLLDSATWRHMIISFWLGRVGIDMFMYECVLGKYISYLNSILFLLRLCYFLELFLIL
jgi:hypothetical protein